MLISALGYMMYSAQLRGRLVRCHNCHLQTSGSNIASKTKTKTKTRQRQRFIFLEVYRVQLGQVHDQHIHQLSNGYAYKFPFIYLDVGNHIPHVFGLHGNETAS